jgi:hypothetical protein
VIFKIENVYLQKLKQNKKTAIAGGFSGIWLGSLRCCFYVNLPLLHRRRAGIAKVKIKVKA